MESENNSPSDSASTTPSNSSSSNIKRDGRGVMFKYSREGLTTREKEKEYNLFYYSTNKQKFLFHPDGSRRLKAKRKSSVIGRPKLNQHNEEGKYICKCRNK